MTKPELNALILSKAEIPASENAATLSPILIWLIEMAVGWILHNWLESLSYNDIQRPGLFKRILLRRQINKIAKGQAGANVVDIVHKAILETGKSLTQDQFYSLRFA